MGSSFHYNIFSGFKAVSAWQQQIMRNAQGVLQPGYNRINLRFGSTPGATGEAGHAGTVSHGGRNASYGGGDSLAISGSTITFGEGTIEPADSPTQLAIKGQGFFLLAENLQPGAKVFMSRSGDFKYDSQGRLVNSQGLFVVGGNGTLTDPPQPVRNPGDGSVVLPSLTLGRVPSPQSLAVSGYGPLVYAATGNSGDIQAFANGRREVGFVQANSLEFVDRTGIIGELQVETAQAQQTYKMFKDMLESFNRSTDDAIGTVR